jgi:hypothetical protein
VGNHRAARTGRYDHALELICGGPRRRRFPPPRARLTSARRGGSTREHAEDDAGGENPARLSSVQDGRRCRGSRADAGQSGGQRKGDGIDCRAGGAGERPRFWFGWSQPRAPPGAASASAVSAARRANSEDHAKGRHRSREPAPADSDAKPGAVARCRGSRDYGALAGARRKATESTAAPAARPGSRGFGRRGAAAEARMGISNVMRRRLSASRVIVPKVRRKSADQPGCIHRHSSVFSCWHSDPRSPPATAAPTVLGTSTAPPAA